MKVALIAFLGAITAILVSAQVPLRGANQPRMSITLTPPLPKSTNVTHLQKLHDQYFILRDCEPNTIIFSHNKPTVEPSETGWRITFK